MTSNVSSVTLVVMTAVAGADPDEGVLYGHRRDAKHARYGRDRGVRLGVRACQDTDSKKTCEQQRAQLSKPDRLQSLRRQSRQPEDYHEDRNRYHRCPKGRRYR